MKRVLVVDDDLDVLESLELVLSRRYQVVVAIGGKEALALAESDAIDVAVIDLMMPRMDGEELIAELRARGIDVPMILASATPELALRAGELSIFGALQKPFTTEALERCLEAALASGGGGGGTPMGGDEPGPGSKAPSAEPRAPSGQPRRSSPRRGRAPRRAPAGPSSWATGGAARRPTGP